MAKKLPSVVGDVSGKLGNVVHVDRAGSPYVRGLPKKGKRGYAPAFKEQSKRAKYLSPLASEVNKAIAYYDNRLKEKTLYQDIMRIFRKQEYNDRLNLLYTLKGLEISSVNKLSLLNSPPSIEVTAERNSLTVNLQMENHPNHGKFSFNCYYLEVVLICWSTEDAPCIHHSQTTSMLSKKGPLPYFEFEFSRPKGFTDYLVAVRESLGKDYVEFDRVNTQGMQIVQVGTISKQNQKWLDMALEEKAQLKLLEQKNRIKTVPVKKVEPKGWREK